MVYPQEAASGERKIHFHATFVIHLVKRNRSVMFCFFITHVLVRFRTQTSNAPAIHLLSLYI